ncbi:MAG: inositol monophosphatase [Chloroflexi bacterium]|nr:inositol monophosphatase [Chloroflexota bacterium]
MPVQRYAALAALAASTAHEVGDAIDIAQVGIVTRKRGRANFATAADHAAQEAVISRLRAHDPAIPVLAEEGAVRSLRRAERVWVVDPIDGTLNFSHGIPFYAVSIAYVEDGAVRAAAVHAPRTGETFIAHQRGGATLNGVAISVSSVSRMSQAFVVTIPSRFALVHKHAARLRALGAASVEICYVAAGRFDLFMHWVLSPWDIAAAGLIAREAGASLISLRSGKDAAWDERQVIIGPRALVRDALSAIPGLVGPARPPARTTARRSPSTRRSGSPSR